MQSPSIKYQLPSEPNVYVDLLDDEDAQLMFDEWHEYTQSALKAANAKLHLFVDWHRRQPLSETSLRKDRLGGLASGETLDTPASNSQGHAHSASAGEPLLQLVTLSPQHEYCSHLETGCRTLYWRS